MATVIDIILPTYNGAAYLHEQIRSIVSQSFTDWRLLARDDGSMDETTAILSQYEKKYPDRIHVISDSLGRLGPARSVETLMYHSNAPYVTFCDQDDVWNPDKLQLFLDRIKARENNATANTPLLVHSDLEVVDEDLTIIADSFWDYQKLRPSKMQSLQRLLVQNCVTGCATMINRPLLSKVLPFPDRVIMHDWWFGLMAAAEGEIHAIPEKTAKYRQHSRNETGAKKWGASYFIQKLIYDMPDLKLSLRNTRDQAKALLQSGKLGQKSRDIVQAYINLYDSNWLSKRVSLLHNGFFMFGFMRNLALFVMI